MFPEKEAFAQGDKPGTLAETLKGADMLIGLSAANVVNPDMLKQMNANPVIFAMANPDPEIKFELAKTARPDAIVGTGRSDFPNQVNNLLGFPFIFRGALEFGRDYVVPKPLDKRVCLWEAPAVAQAAVQSGTARLPFDLPDYREKLAERLLSQ